MVTVTRFKMHGVEQPALGTSEYFLQYSNIQKKIGRTAHLGALYDLRADRFMVSDLGKLSKTT